MSNIVEIPGIVGSKPGEIIVDGFGYHNLHMTEALQRLEKGGGYKDISTVCFIPSRGKIPARVVQNWFSMMTPMNQKFFRFFIIGMEIGQAYNSAFEMVVNHPDLKNWKYVLTMEDDNMPPADGLLKLLEDMDKVDVAGGLYWTKGEAGQPMIYGDPKVMPLNFYPQMPQPETLQRCNGLGMGFTLFKVDIFKDNRIAKPWFKTQQEIVPNVGAKVYTQDLFFFEKIFALGYRVACDTRVRVGHFDAEADFVW
jgi:hypothetical protein